MDAHRVILAANVLHWRPDWAGLHSPEAAHVRTTWSQPYAAMEIRRDDGHWIHVHSRRAPLAEAEAWLTTAAPDGTPASTVVLLGLGLGYVVDVIEQRWPDTRVLAIEANPSIARAFLARRDWRDALDTGRLTVLVGPDYAGASQAWRRLTGDSGPLLLAHPVIARTWPAQGEALRGVLRRIVFDAAANREARRTLGGLYLRHTLGNLPDLVRRASVGALDGHGHGRAAVICAAGPSLDTGLAAVHQWRERCVLIAVDTALRPLLARGIEPDYVVALDPTALNTRHLDGLGRLTHAWLVAEAGLAPTALQAFDDRICFFRVGDNEPWPFLTASGVDVPTLPVWGSVLTAAFSLARHLRCAPVAFIGADLGYPGDRPYARDTAFEIDWARGVLEGTALTRLWRRLIARWPLVPSVGVDGAAISTARHLLAFRDWLEEQCRTSPVAIVNATGAGLFTAAGVEQRDSTFLLRLPSPPSTFRPSPARIVSPESGHVLEAFRRLAPDSATVTAWCASVPELTWEALHPLIADTIERLERSPEASSAWTGPSVVTPHLSACVLHRFPELVAVLDAKRYGRVPDTWAWSALDTACAPLPADLVDCLLAALVEAGPLAHRAAASAALAARGNVLPELRHVLARPWDAQVRTCVLGLVAAAARNVTLAGPELPVRDVAREAGSAPPERPVTDRDNRRYRRAWRRSLVALWTTARLRVPTAGAPPERLLRLLDAADDSPSSVTPPGHVRASVSVRTAHARWRTGMALSRDHLAGALAGRVFTQLSSPAGASRWKVRTSGLEVGLRTTGTAGTEMALDAVLWLDPRWLTDAGLPRCYMGARLAGERAVLTPRHATQSLIVDRHGHAVPGRAWPLALVGEIHGPTWHIGWTQPAPGTLLARRPDGSNLQQVTIDALPISVAWLDELTVAVSTDRGVWRWRPGDALTRLATLPPAVIVAAVDTRLLLDPVPLVEGRLTRERLVQGWALDLGYAHVETRMLEHVGQSWGHDTSHGLEARAFPESNVIGLSIDGDGPPLWMTWPRPRGVAWLGTAMLAWGTDGRVGLLTDALPRLRAAVHRMGQP